MNKPETNKIIGHFENLKIVKTESTNYNLISVKNELNKTLFYHGTNVITFNLNIITESDNFIKAIKFIFKKDYNSIIILYKNLKNLVERGDNDYFEIYAQINNMKFTEANFIKCLI